MNTLIIALFIFALALLAVPLLPRLNAFRRCLLPALVLIALGVCYSQKSYLNPLAHLMSNATFATLQQGWGVPYVEPEVDSDGDGLTDEMEKSGYFSKIILSDADIFSRGAGSVDVWNGWAGTHEVAMWNFGENFVFPIQGKAYTQVSVSQSGMLCFGGALNSTVPVVYPLENVAKNRLRRGIAQFAFLQGLNRIAPGAGTEVFTDASQSDVRRLVFKNVFLDDLNATMDVAVELFSDGRLRFSYGAVSWVVPRRIGWHVGEGGLMVIELPGNRTLELLPFMPTDPNNPDTDGDGLSDYEEVAVYDTDPHGWKSDVNGNGIPDWAETLLGYDPRNADSAPTREEWEASLVDSDGDEWPDIWERLLGSDPENPLSHPDNAVWGLIQLTGSIDGEIPETFSCGSIAFPIFPGSANTITVPVRWGEEFTLPAGFTISQLSGSLILRASGAMLMSVSPSNRYLPLQLVISPWYREETPGHVGTICIHPFQGARNVEARLMPEAFGITLENVDWRWSGAGHAGREFTTDGTYASLKIEPKDSGSLGTLTFTGSVSIPQDFLWQPIKPGVLTRTFGLRRCPPVTPDAPPEDPSEPEDPDGDGDDDDDEEDPYEDPEWCGQHECPKWYCEDLEHTDDDDEEEDDDTPDPTYPPPEEEPEPLIGPTRYTTLLLDSDDSDANGTEDCHQSAFPDVDPDWKKIPLSLPRGTGGNCCACPDHGPNSPRATLYHDSSRISPMAGKRHVWSVAHGELPLYAQGLQPSKNFFDTDITVALDSYTFTNRYTIGRLTLEPDVTRDHRIDADDRRHGRTLHTKGWVLTSGAFHALNLRTEVQLPTGEFTLEMTGSPAELWLPFRSPGAYGSGEYWASDAHAFGRDNKPGPGSEIFLSTAPGGRTAITQSKTQWSYDFVTPTNRVVWLRPLAPGNGRITYRYTGSSPDGREVEFRHTLFYRALPPAIIPDYNRDGVWNETDTIAAANRETYIFWSNDDRDEKSDDAPQTDPGDRDCADLKVNKAADWADFFPVKLNLKPYLQLYPADSHTYAIRSMWGNVNVWEPSLSPEKSMLIGRTPLILNHSGTAAQANLVGSLSAVKRIDTSTPLNLNLLTSIATSNNPHALLLEGRETSIDSPFGSLSLTITENATNQTVYYEVVPIRIVPIETMLHYHNLLSITKTKQDADDSLIYEKYINDNAPWGQDSTRQLFFVHGYNVSSKQCRYWASEMFKRFYWSGSRAEFHAVHWYGFKTQVAEWRTPDFHANVQNAFETSGHLTTLLRTKTPENARAVVVSHSLGAMLASAALRGYADTPVSDLVIINAAVALEAYDGEAGKEDYMINHQWRYLYPEKTFASEWHTLFREPEGDPRYKLTWRNIFQRREDVTYHQFYSRGEEVTRDPPVIVSIDTSLVSPWGTQELWKGCTWPPFDYIGASTLMGWGFSRPLSNLLEPYTPAQAAGFDEIRLRRDTVFCNSPSDLFSNSDMTARACAVVQRYELLAQGIPARTFSAGANPVTGGSGFITSVDMNEYVNAEENPWLRPSEERWKHSDLREMPYPSVFKLFDKITDVTQLKGN